MQLVSLNDAMFLLAEGRERPMHVGGLQLFRPPQDAGPDYVAEVYQQALHDGEVMPRLRRRPRRPLMGLGPWLWEDDPDLDLEYHVRHSALPHPGRVRELLALTSRLHGTLLDRNRALWEAHVIEGLDDGRFALYTKIHHALVDGVSAMRLLERGLSTRPDDRDMPPPFAVRGPERGRTGGSEGGDGPLAGAAGAVSGAIAAGVEGARAIVGASDAAVRSVLRSFSDQAQAIPYKAPRSILNRPITGARRFAADSWRLARIKAVGAALDATVNDVVMAMCSGALRRYLLELDALPDQPLVAMVPVSLKLRAAGAASESESESEDVTSAQASGNEVGLVLCNLGTHLAEPGARFALVHSSMQVGKMRLEGLNSLGVLLLSALSMSGVGMGIAPFYDELELMQRPPFNVIVSNVPGPRQRLYWNGAELDGTYPVSIPFDGQALNITVSSYADEMGFGLIGCRRTVPHLQRLLDHLETSLAELEALAGTS
ncbi:MAG TPA: wax ester/triacylglycerol synthase family O-acyltransferase [Nitriliruptorales bacterium]